MKKLSLLLALILCVTIGGVYANWFYAGTQADNLHHHIADMSLTDPNTTTKYGTYEVKTGDDTIKIKFDQSNQTPGSFDYHAVLIFMGEMKVTFTADPAFTGEPKAKFKLTSEKNLTADDTTVKYLGEKIFVTYNTEEQPLTFTYDDSTKVWTATITVDMIEDLIAINPNIELDTKAKYDAFQAILSAMGKVGIEIVDKTTAVVE